MSFPLLRLSKNSPQLNLSARQPGTGPAYESSNGRIEFWEPEPSNIVRLHVDAVTVVARIVAAYERDYTGNIIEFEDWEEYEFEGSKPGDRVDFLYENIFDCERKRCELRVGA